MGRIGYILTGIVGAALGSGVTWFFTNKYWVERNAQELEACKQYVDRRLEELDSREPKKSTEPVNTEPQKPLDPPTKPREPKSYHSIIAKHYNVDDVDDEEIEKAAELMAEREAENVPKDKPYLIHMDAYNGDDEVHYQESYTHLTLDYYSGDDKVALSDTNELIDNPEKILGWDWRIHFGDERYGCDENCVYVRNDERRVDYEIVRDKGYYCQIILGIDPPEDE